MKQLIKELFHVRHKSKAESCFYLRKYSSRYATQLAVIESAVEPQLGGEQEKKRRKKSHSETVTIYIKHSGSEMPTCNELYIIIWICKCMGCVPYCGPT